MEPDFSGYATKAGLQCSDGRTIMPGAFKHQDKARVPLVWQHGHTDVENVLGHAILENREDGVYTYGYFNKSKKAEHAKTLIEHGDIKMLSIWANELVERSQKVLHGAIREVSLVLSGANPGALIENVTMRHSDGEDMTLDDEVIIYTGLELQHTDETAKDEEEVKHADDATDDETVQDVYDSMSDKQKQVLHFMVGQALEESTTSETETKHDNLDEETDTQKGTEEMNHNVFEKKDEVPPAYSLSHSDITGIIADATKTGSLKDAVESFALAHGIDDIDILFPDAVALDKVPEFLKRRTEWVGKVLGAARKSPFSRIKTLSADITVEEARAKGYIKGTLKKEEFFGVSKRVTTPTTVYKKQKLDRDDLVDITDFDVVAWLKAEMRLMLDEELARAILISDGRDVAHEDKINEGNIRPIAKDHELYVTTVNVNIGDANSTVTEIVDAIILNRHNYKGTGLPTMFTTETVIAQFLLLKDTLGRRIYKSLDEVASELRVAEIVSVEVMEEEPDIVAILVNMNDYIVGATAGGQVTMFDDFDIDYNQYKYLIETRMCGALTKLKSAIVVRKTAAGDTAVVPTAPVWTEATHSYTVPTIVGVEYLEDGNVVTSAGNPHALTQGGSVVVSARATAGHYFSTTEDTSWTFTYRED
jgi:HK97 family phage prohead protease